MTRRYNNEKLYKAFITCFCHLPTAALVEQNLFCMHGGISENLKITDVNNIPKPQEVPDYGV